MKIKPNNKNWPYIPDHPYRILITGGSASGKTNLWLNLIENTSCSQHIKMINFDNYTNENKTKQ